MRVSIGGAFLSYPTPAPRLSHPSTGFTLVELIIALALIGLITLLLFSGIRLGTRAWDGVEAISEQNAEPRIARNFLSSALSQLRPVQVTFDAQKFLLFGGDAKNIEFVAPLSEHVGTPGLYVLRLSLAPSDSSQLILTRRLFHPDVLDGFGDVPEWVPLEAESGPTDFGSYDKDLAGGVVGRILLLEGVEELEIGYFGIGEGEQDPQWNSQWLDEPRLPLAIRIHLTLRKQPWPDLLIRLPHFEYPTANLRP